jgi:hypothetical protein
VRLWSGLTKVGFLSSTQIHAMHCNPDVRKVHSRVTARAWAYAMHYNSDIRKVHSRSVGICNAL